MIYLLFGKYEAKVKEKEKSLIKNFLNEEQALISEFDLQSDLIDSVINECNQLSLTSDKKAVVCRNANFLTTVKNSLKDDEVKNINAYFDNENEDCLLIFEVFSNNVARTNNIVKKIEKKGKIIEIAQLSSNEWPLYIKKYFKSKGIVIDDDAALEFSNRIQDDYYFFKNESDKLMLLGKNTITFDDININVTKPLEDKVFDILNYLIANDKDHAIRLYRDLIINKVEPVSLISLITTSLLFLDKISCLVKQGYSQNEIAGLLKCSSGRIYYSLKNLSSLKGKNLSDIFDNLYDLDYKIKHSQIDRFYGFEMLLINF